MIEQIDSVPIKLAIPIAAPQRTSQMYTKKTQPRVIYQMNTTQLMDNKHMMELPREYETAVAMWNTDIPKNPPTMIPFLPNFWNSFIEQSGPNSDMTPMIPLLIPGEILDAS
mgnify:CR=1 FL=1